MLGSVNAAARLHDSDGLAAIDPPRRHIGAKWGWFAGAGVVLLLGAVAAIELRGMVTAPPVVATPVEPPPALSVAITPVALRPMQRAVVGDGSVVAWQELAVDAEAGGLRVVDIAVDEGDQVRRGQVLVRFDATVLAAQAAQAEAALAEAEAALAIARSDFNRGSELSRGGFIAAQTVEQRQSVARQAEARVMATRARRDEAAARLAQTQLLAPADGVVIRRSVQLGAVPAQGQEMLRIARDGRLELDAKVPELELATVQPGQTALVVHGETKVEATVRAVAPMVAADTRLGVVHLSLPAASGLRPGMFARAEMRVDAAPILVLPHAAIVFHDDAPAAFVLGDANRVTLRRLTIGLHRDGFVEIVAGLRQGELVVASGAGFLADGDRVRVVSPLVATTR